MLTYSLKFTFFVTFFFNLAIMIVSLQWAYRLRAKILEFT